VVDELQAKMSRLCELMDESSDAQEFERLFALFAQSTNRLGRLLRDKRALSGESADSLLEMVAGAVDELSTELGWSAFDERG